MKTAFLTAMFLAVAGISNAASAHVDVGIGLYAPAPQYAPPPAVIYGPPPVVYGAPPVVYGPPPAVYGPPPGAVLYGNPAPYYRDDGREREWRRRQWEHHQWEEGQWRDGDHRDGRDWRGQGDRD